MREPSPPFEHVSWREEVEHDANEDVTVLAVTVMGGEAESAPSPVVPSYLAKIARYPLWAICIRALVGAAVVPIPVFLYAGTRLHYFVGAPAHSHVDQNAVLSGVMLAFAGALVGMAIGALWGMIVVGHARRMVRKAHERVGADPREWQMSSDIDVSALRAAAEREIADGLAACQVAVARDGEVVYFESFGSADDETRFGVASATKPIVASATWQLIGEGLLDIDRRVAEYVPEFGTHGKDVVTVEQVYLMTCGFPTAPMEATEGADPARRVARFAEWELEYEPGTQYVYHGGSAHWVLAELIQRLGGMDFRDYVEARVTRPLGLPRLLGIPRAEQTNIAQFSLPSQPESRPGYDRAAMIEAGIPGGGGVMTAATLARFYQGVLNNPNGLWKPDVLADATSNIRCTLPDPMMGLPANRTIGVVIGNGFGTTWGKSPTAYGWPGAGGQVGFAEPATGVSFSFLQSGDADPINVFVRAIRMSELALELGR